jgi:hypothetical protein
MSVTLTVGPHQIASYSFWRHTNDTTGKESIFLNTTSNNFLKSTKYNYSCNPLNRPINSMKDFTIQK